MAHTKKIYKHPTHESQSFYGLSSKHHSWYMMGYNKKARLRIRKRKEIALNSRRKNRK